MLDSTFSSPLFPALLTDRYQLTMLTAYAQSELAERRAVFELFVRKLPACRRFMVACGLGRALSMLRHLSFPQEALARFEQDAVLGPTFRNPKVRNFFETFQFRAKVYAIPEGHICFPHEPLLRVDGTLSEAQLVETLLLSMINHDTRVASKCARIVLAADGRDCFEFGSRRTHEMAAIDAARAAYIAGFVATSNEEAGRRYAIPVLGTMAHSFILAHAADDGEAGEISAFHEFFDTFQNPIACLVDTFEPLRGVERAIEVCGTRLGSIRIDSGDLAALAKQARATLNQENLTQTRIVLSDDLDENRIHEFIQNKIPVDAFGVGTMAVCTPDAPALGAVYKLVEIEDRTGRMRAVQKRSPGKGSTAGIKQVFRREDTVEDTLGLDGEDLPGKPLLQLVFDGHEIIVNDSLETIRDRLKNDLAHAHVLSNLALRTEHEGFPCQKSNALCELHAHVDCQEKQSI